jgi:hypothetical protein
MMGTLEGKVRIENSVLGTFSYRVQRLGMACTFYGESSRRILLSVLTLC